MLEFTRITQDPDVLEGKPCVRHLRVTIATIFNLIAAGKTPEEIMGLNEELQMEDLREALRFAAWRIEEPSAMPPPVSKLEKKALPTDATPASSLQLTTAKPPAEPSPQDQPRPDDSLQENRPCLVVTRVGIFDRRLGVGIIAWRDIHSISTVKRKGKDAVRLEVIKPQRYFHRMSPVQRSRANLRTFLRIAPFCIEVKDTGYSAEELELRIKKIWVIFRNDSWRASKAIPAFEEIVDAPPDIQPLPPRPVSEDQAPVPEARPLADMIHFPEELKRALSWKPPKKKPGPGA